LRAPGSIAPRSRSENIALQHNPIAVLKNTAQSERYVGAIQWKMEKLIHNL
jgi:hypothetical protein